MRATKAHRNAKALHRSNGDIRAHLTRRFQQRQRQRIGGQHGNRLGCHADREIRSLKSCTAP
jgi:hypothetical protein